jgi:hypothetical protein
MPLKSAGTQVGFSVSGVACPDGSECIDALKCVEMGGKCVEGTAGCGGRAQNCCCLLKPPARVELGPLILAVGAMAFFALAYSYELWKIMKRS